MRAEVNEESTFGYPSSGVSASVKLNLPRAAVTTATAIKGAEAPGAEATMPVVKISIL